MTRIQMRTWAGILAGVVAFAGASPAANFNASNLKGTFVFRLVPATGFAPVYDGTAGKPNSGVATAPRQDVLRVGVFKTDGKGGVIGHTIATTDDGRSTVIIDYNWTGTYTVSTNIDGTGILTINPPTAADINSCRNGDGTALSGCADMEGGETFAFAVSGSKKSMTIRLIQTDNVGGGAKIFLTGDADTQSPKGSSGGTSIAFPF